MRGAVALLVVLLTATAAFAAEDGAGPAQDVHRGDLAVMFDMGGVFSATPSAFEGIGIGGVYALQELLHLRAAVGIDNSSTKVDLGSGSSSEDKASTYAIEAGVNYLLMRNENLILYTGGILQYGMGSSEPEGENNDTDTSMLTIAGLLGVTWFFTDNVSLGAEYRLGFQTASSEPEAGGEATTTRIGTGSAAFLMGFWF